MRYLILFFFVVLTATQAHSEGSSCTVADAAFREASEIRGLKAKSKVPCFLRDKEQVEKYLKTEIGKQLPNDKLRGAELLYKTLGFVPESFDYKKELVSLYLGQLAGYYDPEAKHYIMASWFPDSLQPTIAVHEMTHALQDQYWNLKALLDETKLSTDEALAKMALVEGDATGVMNDFQRKLAGLSPIKDLESVDSIVLQTVLGSFLTQGLATAPEVLKNVMIFPYASGLRFVHSELRRGGYFRIDKVFERPPLSTEEILHPEVYQRGQTDFRKIEDGEFLTKEQSLFEDTLGEFLISLWLSELLKDKSRGLLGANGWGGDRVKVWDSGHEQKLEWISNWDSEFQAKEFEDLAREGVQKAKLRLVIERDVTKVRIITKS